MTGYRRVRRLVCKRVMRRMREIGTADLRAYRDHSRRELAAALGRGADSIECLSAGCTAGEEPYTVTMMWRVAPTLRPGGVLVIASHERLPDDMSQLVGWPVGRGIYRAAKAVR